MSPYNYTGVFPADSPVWTTLHTGGIRTVEDLAEQPLRTVDLGTEQNRIETLRWRARAIMLSMLGFSEQHADEALQQLDQASSTPLEVALIEAKGPWAAAALLAALQPNRNDRALEV